VQAIQAKRVTGKILCRKNLHSQIGLISSLTAWDAWKLNARRGNEKVIQLVKERYGLRERLGWIGETNPQAAV